MGISAVIGGIVDAFASVGTTVAAGVGTLAGGALSAGALNAIGAGVTTGLEGAALGAGTAALTGGNIGKGALGGALTGGFIGGLGPAIGSATGLGAAGADALAGAAGGALGAEITGGKPLQGALMGGASGFLAGGGLSRPSASAGAGGGGSVSAASTAAPTTVPTQSPDITTQALGSDVLYGSGGGAPAGGSAASAQLPGSVGTGAASGAGAGTPNLPSTEISHTETPVAANSNAPAAGHSGFNLGNLVPLALASTMLRPQKMPAYAGQLAGQANQMMQQSQQLESYIQSGLLPPGIQASMNSAAESAKATVRSQYANRGMSGSSAEAQDLANLEQRIAAQGGEIATQLFSQGLNESQIASGIYQNLMQTMIQQDQEASSAIGNLAGSLALMAARG